MHNATQSAASFYQKLYKDEHSWKREKNQKVGTAKFAVTVLDLATGAVGIRSARDHPEQPQPAAWRLERHSPTLW